MWRAAERRALAAALAGALAMAGSAGCSHALALSEPRGEEHLDAMAEGGRHSHHGRDEEAAEAYHQAEQHAERRVDRDEAAYRRAKALEEEGELREALAVLEEIAARRPMSRRTVRAMYDAALIRQELGEEAEAQQTFRRIVREHPDSAMAKPALHRVIRHHTDRDDVAGAVAYLAKLDAPLAGSELHDNVLKERAELLLEREGAGDREQARALLERVVEEHPYPQGGLWDNALWTLADLDEEDGQLRKAIGRLEQLTERRETTPMVGSYTLPLMPKAQLRIGRLHRELGQLEAAADAWWTLYDDYETSTLRDDALVAIGEMWLEAGRTEDGCELLRRATEEFEVGSARRRAAERLEADCGGGG